MFRKNDQPKQSSFFDSDFVLPERLKQRLQQSWAGTFRAEVFERIPEEEFAMLYSGQDSRPNAPVNVIVGADILKNGFGWTDEELEERLSFDLLVRSALGLTELTQEVPTLRTIYNFRRRVREYAQQSGENLYERVFEIVTDGQLQKLELATGWQRMDSTQLLSNIARLNRLELVLTVLQKGVKALPPEQQTQWQEQYSHYLKRRPQNICYRLQESELEGHLLQVGQLLVELAQAMVEAKGDDESVQLVQRTLADQYDLDQAQAVQLRPSSEVSSTSLQSPHDPEATFRHKGGRIYRGYVTNLSETCDPSNPLQLITSVQTEPNQTDDEQLLVQALPEQARRQVGLEQLTTDGGYTGPEADQAGVTYGVQLRPTRIRGGTTAADRFGWERYQWQLDQQGQPTKVTCPTGQQVSLQPGRKAQWRKAQFQTETCATCPFFQQQCRVIARKKGPILSVTLRNIQVARLRQGMTPDNKATRAAVEATVRSLKRPFPGGQLPVRGLIRAQMLLFCSAIVVNLRRLHRYFLAQTQLLGIQPSPFSERASFSFFLSVFSLFLLFLIPGLPRFSFNLSFSWLGSSRLPNFRSGQYLSFSGS